MSRDEFKARNGTLSINQQTKIQREKISSRFNGKGVASNNANLLFSKSPIGYNDELPSRVGGGLYQEGVETVYEAYAVAIDSPDGVSGFGFSGSGSNLAFMNYNHPDVRDDLLFSSGSLNLSDGSKNTSEDPFNGFPNPIVPEDAINNPSIISRDGNTFDENYNLPSGGGASYGHETAEYRKRIETRSTNLGIHASSADKVSNGTVSETLGAYFTKIYVAEQE